MTDVDQILRDHASDAAGAEPDADGWERLLGRLEGDPALIVPVDRPVAGRGRWLAFVAAAVVVLVAGVVAVVATDDDGADVQAGPSSSTSPLLTDPTTAGTSPDSTTASTSPSTSSSVPIAPGPMPTTAAVVVDPDGDGFGDVARLSELGPTAVADGAGRLTTLVAAAPVPDGEPVASGSGALRVDVGPDGVAYYERCCEPAVGEVWAVDLATGEDRGRVASGEAPAVSPDGRSLAVSVQGVGVQVIDLAAGTTSTVVEEAHSDRIVTHLAWSPDGRTLARGRIFVRPDAGPDDSPSVEVLDLDQPEDGWRPVGPDAGPGWAFPTFLADGRLVVATGAVGGLDGVTATGISVVDLATGGVQGRFGGLEITGLDGTADGRWILAVGSGSVLRAFTGDDLHDVGTIAQLDGGILSAAW